MKAGKVGCGLLNKIKNMTKKNYHWCGFHEVPISRCNRTSSWSCYPLDLTKEESDKLKEKVNKSDVHYNITDKELTG